MGDRWAYNRGISAALGTGDTGTPGLRRREMREGGYYGNQNTRCGKTRYTVLKKIISSYVSSHLSKCCHQNPVYLHQLE